MLEFCFVSDFTVVVVVVVVVFVLEVYFALDFTVILCSRFMFLCWSFILFWICFCFIMCYDVLGLGFRAQELCCLRSRLKPFRALQILLGIGALRHTKA